MAAQNVLAALSDEFASLVEAGAPRVVQVVSRGARPATGTVFRRGRVLVPAHAVDADDELKVRDGAGGLVPARYAGADPATNLAVLRVEGLEAEPLEPSAGARVGEIVLGLGRTWSASVVASAGIVSAIGGPLRAGRARSVETVLRADVRVHPLGAGGPLLEAAGRGVGIAIGASMRGLPLFLPASIAWQAGQAIDEHGGIKRGYLGINAQPVRIPGRQLAGRQQEWGLLVVGLAAGSPADQAGVLVGDLITGFDGQPTEDHEALLSLLSDDRVGKPAKLDVIRGGQFTSVEVVVASR